MQKGVVRKRRPSPLSEYGRQLKEKQELKAEYNLRERQFKGYVTETLTHAGSGNLAELLLQHLERRLDNVVYRMGMAETRKKARQMVSHGHFLVNSKPVDIPSYMTKNEDVISLRANSEKKTLFQNTKLAMKNYEAPSWLQLDKEKMEATITGIPSFEEIGSGIEIPLVFEFYSR